MELALDEAEHQAGLPDGRLAQQHQLELTDLVPRVGPIGSGCAAATGHDLLRSPAAVPPAKSSPPGRLLPDRRRGGGVNVTAGLN